MVFLLYGKVTPPSVTEYIYSSRGAGNGVVASSGVIPRPPGCCVILANGLRFQSFEADLGSWLARGFNWTFGRHSIEAFP